MKNCNAPESVHRLVLLVTATVAFFDSTLRIVGLAESGVSAAWNASNFEPPGLSLVPPPPTVVDHILNSASVISPVVLLTATGIALISATSWFWTRWVIAMCCVEVVTVIVYMDIEHLIPARGDAWTPWLMHLNQAMYLSAFHVFVLIYCVRFRETAREKVNSLRGFEVTHIV